MQVENNSLEINGHPAWATAYDLKTNVARPMDIVTNTFCAGGSHMGNGSFLSGQSPVVACCHASFRAEALPTLTVGGNYDVVPGGGEDTPGGPNPYGDAAGGRALRLLTPCSDGTCQWSDDNPDEMPLPRWYPTIETIEDGSVLIIGGSES